MHNCTITTKPIKNSVSVFIVGEDIKTSSKIVLDEIKKMKKKGGADLSMLNTDSGKVLLVKIKEEEWLAKDEAERIAGSKIITAIRSAKEKACTIKIEDKSKSQALIEGIILGDYKFTDYKKEKPSKIKVSINTTTKIIEKAKQVAVTQNETRNIADQPGNVITPKSFITRAKKMLSGLGLKITTVEGVAKLKKANFPGLVQVGKGSENEPALLKISYKAKTKSKKQLAFVGKGLTFDSGGISLKPGSGMAEMMGDKGGAIAVLGAMKMIALQKPKTSVTAYIALAENMPDGKAFRPGDIYKARNGKSIHVDNTDAEGRLVLADVLTYACEEKATHLVDAATLTGACLVALGADIAGILGTKKEFTAKVREAGQEAGEELWELPLYGEYKSLLEHGSADLNNMGGRWGGTITAALFLSEFITDKVSWVHVDLAGPAIQDKKWRYYQKGMTAFGARSLAMLAGKL